jgi:hypothetical protein
MKTKIEKLLKRLQSIIDKIDKYNEYLNDNKYSERSTSYLSFNVKAYGWTDIGDLKDLEAFKALSEANQELVLEEFDDDRISGTYYHVLEDKREWFVEQAINGETYDGIFKHMKERDISFYGRQGGHLCLGTISEWEAELSDIGLDYYPFYQYIRNEGCQWIHPTDIDTAIQELKEHFGVTTQRRVYELLKADIVKDFEPFIKNLDKNMEQFLQLEEDIKEYKDSFKDELIEQLKYEVETFIEDNFSYEDAILAAENGDYSKLDSILKIEDDKIVTNRNAVVSLKAAIETIKHIDAGKDVKSEKISAYTINVVDRRDKDTYVKIGCHLFSLSQTKLQLNLNS